VDSTRDMKVYLSFSVLCCPAYVEDSQWSNPSSKRPTKCPGAHNFIITSDSTTAATGQMFGLFRPHNFIRPVVSLMVVQIFVFIDP